MKVNCSVNILSENDWTEIPNAWNNEDFVNILDLLGFTDEVAAPELKEMAMMALADQSPEESAELLLEYRMSEDLTKGQIQQLSHEMQEDKTSEEYPEIALQHKFFDVNQLLFKSFNGRFPNCHATELNLELTVSPASLLEDKTIVNEIIIKALLPGLGEHSVIARLYEDEIAGKKRFDDADSIIWKSEVKKQENGSFKVQLFSSEYWLHDFPGNGTYETSFKIFESEKESV